MTDNRLLKLVSLLAAILLAYSVTSDRNSSVLSMSVPLEIKNPPEDRVLVRPQRRVVHVTLRGPSFLVGPIASSPPPLKVMLPDKMDDRIQVTLKASDLQVPSMIEVLSVEPSQMEFVFEPLERREFKVEVPRVGQLAKQLTLSRIDFEPKVVTLRGPRSELRQVKVIESEPLALEDITESQTLTLALRNPAPMTILGVKNVNVRVAINEIPDQLVFSRRPVELRTVPAATGVVIEPTEVAVTVEGPPDAISRMKGDEVFPFIRVRELPPLEGKEIEVRVELPNQCADCKVVKVEPASVMVYRDKGLKKGLKLATEKKRT
jgi:YbbR domain-containing protein